MIRIEAEGQLYLQDENKEKSTKHGWVVNEMLQAKLSMPHVGKNIVRRKKLEEKLRLLPDYRLACLTAPAGYGKTTAVTDYLKKQNIKYAWFSVDEADNNPVRFWRYFTASISECLKNTEITWISLDEDYIEISVHSFINTIINMIERTRVNFVLVLDEYHVITNNIVLSSVEYFIKYMPQNISVIIISRKYPDNMLSVMCSRGMAIHIGMKDFAFDIHETVEFFAQKELGLEHNELKIIQDYTEGWAAGIMAASLSIKENKEVYKVIKKVSGMDKNINIILEKEVWGMWTEEIKDFLIYTSFLTELSGPLCMAVTGNRQSAGVLKLLSDNNSFIISLDMENQWYRYHKLFREFLVNRLELLDEVCKIRLYKKAGEWYLQNKMPQNGIHWMLRAGEYKKALPYIINCKRNMLTKGELIIWKQWIDTIPEFLYEDNPLIYASYAWIVSIQNCIDIAQVWVKKAKSCFERIKSIMEQEERNYTEAYILLTNINIAVLNMDTTVVSRYINKLSQIDLRLIIRLGEINWFEPNLLKTAYGFYGRLKKIERFLPVGDNLHQMLSGFTSYMDVIVAELYYERNRLKEVDTVLINNMGMITEVNNPGLIVPCFMLMAKAKKARGNINGAFKSIEDARKQLGEQAEGIWKHYLDIFTAYLYLCVGDSEKASKLIGFHNIGLYDELSNEKESEFIVFVRYLIHKSRLDDALILLNRLINYARRERRLGSRMEILCLTAICYEKKGDYNSSMTLLEQAFSIGMKEGYIRTFVDEVHPIAALLGKYITAKRNSKYLVYAKNLFRRTNEYIRLLEGDCKVNKKECENVDFSVNLLSKREIEVINLLIKKRTNEEIAKELFISVSTVKQHNSRIYDKLGVKNRVEAIIRAKEMGFRELHENCTFDSTSG